MTQAQLTTGQQMAHQIQILRQRLQNLQEVDLTLSVRCHSLTILELEPDTEHRSQLLGHILQELRDHYQQQLNTLEAQFARL